MRKLDKILLIAFSLTAIVTLFVKVPIPMILKAIGWIIIALHSFFLLTHLAMFIPFIAVLGIIGALVGNIPPVKSVMEISYVLFGILILIGEVIGVTIVYFVIPTLGWMLYLGTWDFMECLEFYLKCF